MNLEFVLRFLSLIAKNNNREWFEKNKSTYLEAKQYFEDFVVKFFDELLPFNPELRNINPRKLPFRIYRDVRFSKDKRPYKTNMGCGFSSKGKLVQEPGYYIHIEPQKSFFAGGIYMPSSEYLAKVRQEIDYNGDELERIFNDKKFQHWYKDFEVVDKLKTAPKGYPKDHVHIDWLQHKSFIVSHSFSDEEVVNKNFIRQITGASIAMKPLITFLKTAIA